MGDPARAFAVTELDARIFDERKQHLSRCSAEAATAARVGTDGSEASDKTCHILALGKAALEEGCPGAVMKLEDNAWAYMPAKPIREINGQLWFHVHTSPEPDSMGTWRNDKWLEDNVRAITWPGILTLRDGAGAGAASLRTYGSPV